MSISTFYSYLLYVLRHKWYVFVACCLLARRQSRPAVIWRGIIHDLSKFRPSELLPYAAYFNSLPEQRSSAIKLNFKQAVRLHKSRNRHHPEWWTRSSVEGVIGPQEMDDLSILELIADWQGAGLAQGHGDNTLEWYAVNRHQLPLAPATRAKVERLIGFSSS